MNDRDWLHEVLDDATKEVERWPDWMKQLLSEEESSSDTDGNDEKHYYFG